MKNQSILGAVLLLLVLIGKPIFSSNILGYLVSPSRSHFIMHDSLLRGLAAKGHNVSVNNVKS